MNILKLTAIVATLFVASTATAELKKPSVEWKGVLIQASEAEKQAYMFANPYYVPECKKVLRDGNRYVWVCSK